MLLSTGSKRVGHNSATEQQQPTSLDLKFSYMIIFSAGSLLPIGSVGVGVHSTLIISHNLYTLFVGAVLGLSCIMWASWGARA